MTVDFFFYGTLRDAEVRRIVLGPGGFSLTAEPAMLEGYRCAPVERGRFPGIVPDAEAATPGVLLRRASLDAAARTSYFESDGADYEIALKPVVLDGGRRAEAWICIPTAALPVEAGEWRFEAWKLQCRAAGDGAGPENCESGDGAGNAGRTPPAPPGLVEPAQPRAGSLTAMQLRLRRFRILQASRASMNDRPVIRAR